MTDARIRVVHVVWRLSRGGGVPAVSRWLLTGLDPGRFDAHAVTVRPNLAEDCLHELGPHVTLHPLGHVNATTSRPAELLLGLRIAARIRALRPDVVHVHSGTARLSVPAALARPRARWLIDVHEPLYGGMHSRLTDALETRLIRHAGYRPVVHSTAVRADTARALGWPVDRVSLVPLGVEPRPPEPAAAAEFRRQHDIPAADRLVLYVGRAATKNVPLFLRVAHAVLGREPGGVTFAVVGDASQAVRDLHTELGLGSRVRLVPILPSLAPAFDAADLFLSTADYEGFGLAVTEAMAAGTPVVCTAVGGVPDQVVDGVTGRLVPRRDQEALTEAVCTLLGDDALRLRMAAAARRHVEESFSLARMVGDFEDLYRELARPRSRADLVADHGGQQR